MIEAVKNWVAGYAAAVVMANFVGFVLLACVVVGGVALLVLVVLLGARLLFNVLEFIKSPLPTVSKIGGGPISIQFTEALSNYAKSVQSDIIILKQAVQDLKREQDAMKGNNEEK